MYEKKRIINSKSTKKLKKIHKEPEKYIQNKKKCSSVLKTPTTM